MGYSVWDRETGSPVTNKRYVTLNGAKKACDKFNATTHQEFRYYVKTL